MSMSKTEIVENNGKKLDKKGKLTLIVSLILAVVFIVIGVVVLIVQNRKGFSFDNPIEITDDSGYYYNCDVGDRMYYSYYSTSSGYITIKVEGAYIYDVTDINGYPTYYEVISSGTTTYRVKIAVDYYMEYVIQVKTTADYMRINVV